MNPTSKEESSRETFCMMSSTSLEALKGRRGVSDTPRKLSIEYISPHDLKLDPNNPRIHSRKQERQIARSIKTFGFLVPVQADSDGKVIAGHGRVLAARELGMLVIPVIRLEHLTPAQLRAFAIAENKLTENAEWNPLLLGEQLKALSEAGLDFSVEVTGFEISEIDMLIEALEPATENTVDPADELPKSDGAVPVTKLGDLWLLGRHRVLCANALEENDLSVLMHRQKASAVFVDPPFNVKIDGHVGGLGKIKHREFQMASGEMNEPEFRSFLTRAFRLLVANSVDGSLHYVCMDWRHLGELLHVGDTVYEEFKALCIWNKGTGGMGSLYRSQHELILVFKNGKAPHRNNIQLGQFGRYRTNVWDYPGLNSFARSTEEGNLLELHPTTKPVALVADAIKDCTAHRDIVLDTFLGSGTTVIAAERTGRVCYGMEIDPLYVDTIVRRWQRFTSQSATHAASGKSFEELEREVTSE
jgi:DNA modification methylase